MVAGGWSEVVMLMSSIDPSQNHFPKIARPIRRPSFCWRPDLLSGIPMRRLTRLLACEIPKKRHQLNPPRFMRPLMSAIAVSFLRIACVDKSFSLLNFDFFHRLFTTRSYVDAFHFTHT